MMTAMTPTLTAARLAIVSGKGGVGKTTVAAAIAVAAARAGMQVLLAEVEDRESFAPLFGLERIGYVERRIGSNLHGLSVLPDEALIEYLQLFYGIPKLSRALVHSKAVDFATNTAPGLRDILLIGKIKEAEQRRHEGAHVYDLIVLDAPPTGRLPRFLDAPRAIVELVHSGPIERQAQGVLDMVHDPKRTQVVLVTQPEDMPVRETIEAADALAKMNVALGPMVVNGIWPSIEMADAATLRAQAEAAGMALDDAAIAALHEVATAHATRARNQQASIADLRDACGLQQVHLPYLFTERVARAEVDSLAATLHASGAMG